MPAAPIEIVVASGKGGTGKTFISSNLLYYFKSSDLKCVGVDADAEAPDLALALGDYAHIKDIKEVYESRKASIDYSKCTLCLNCLNHCRFSAIELHENVPKIVEEYCEGCGACALVCPAEAISFREVLTGRIIVGTTRSDVDVVTSDLEVSGRNTGHLVYLARETAKRIYPNIDIIVVDAAAGIGCPVISSIVGSTHLVVVVEPTPQSLQGAKRLVELAKILNVDYSVVINKADLNRDFIEEIHRSFGSKIIGEIPYSKHVIDSYVEMKPLLEYRRDSDISKTLTSIFDKLTKILKVRA